MKIELGDWDALHGKAQWYVLVPVSDQMADSTVNQRAVQSQATKIALSYLSSDWPECTRVLQGPWDVTESYEAARQPSQPAWSSYGTRAWMYYVERVPESVDPTYPSVVR